MQTLTFSKFWRVIVLFWDLCWLTCLNTYQKIRNWDEVLVSSCTSFYRDFWVIVESHLQIIHSFRIRNSFMKCFRVFESFIFTFLYEILCDKNSSDLPSSLKFSQGLCWCFHDLSFGSRHFLSFFHDIGTRMIVIQIHFLKKTCSCVWFYCVATRTCWRALPCNSEFSRTSSWHIEVEEVTTQGPSVIDPSLGQEIIETLIREINNLLETEDENCAAVSKSSKWKRMDKKDEEHPTVQRRKGAAANLREQSSKNDKAGTRNSSMRASGRQWASEDSWNRSRSRRSDQCINGGFRSFDVPQDIEYSLRELVRLDSVGIGGKAIDACD